MNLPPPPGGAPPPPPSYGGGPGPYPGHGSPQPPWPPQQPWSAAPPPKRGRGWKWVLGAVALLAVVGLTAAVTLSVAEKGPGDDGTPTAPPTTGSGPSSDIASAGDNGPVAVITEDPSCAAQGPIFQTLAAQEKNGWAERDPSIPAMAWTPELRAQYEAVGRAMRNAADQLVPLVKLTPHRVMRELYEQVIAFSRAFADSIPSYTAPSDNLARVSIAASDAISRICAAITYSSAAARGPLVPPLSAPSQVAPLGDPADPQRFLTGPNPVCVDWVGASSQFVQEVTAWAATDPDIPVNQWGTEQKALNDEVVPVMRRIASQFESLGARSGNPTLRDFADLSAQYRRAYVQALSTYTPADKYLAEAALLLGGVVRAACQAVEE